MKINRFEPSERMRPYVDHYCLYSTNEQTLTNIILPEGYTEIGFNLSDEQILTKVNGVEFAAANVKFLGQLTTPCVTHKLRCLLVVRFYPYSASLFFPNPMQEFTNGFYDLSDVFHNEIDSLYDQIRETEMIPDKIRTVEAYLEKKLIKQIRKVPILKSIKQACSLITEGKPSLNMVELSKKTGLSVRYMQRLFGEHIGVSPKVFSNIMRFQKGKSLLENTDDQYTAIAHHCGYYDQAHFITEFKTFSNTTPAAHRLITRIRSKW
jgi:AraC-like DNA-binding protein